MLLMDVALEVWYFIVKKIVIIIIIIIIIIVIIIVIVIVIIIVIVITIVLVTGKSFVNTDAGPLTERRSTRGMVLYCSLLLLLLLLLLF